MLSSSSTFTRGFAGSPKGTKGNLISGLVMKTHASLRKILGAIVDDPGMGMHQSWCPIDNLLGGEL